MLRLLTLLALVFCLNTGVIPCFAADPASDMLNGQWSLTANQGVGALILKVNEEGKITGAIFGDKLEGKFDSRTKSVTLQRMATQMIGGLRPVQLYSGLYSENKELGNCILKGTFKAVVEKGWGDPAVEYEWKATTGHLTQAISLRELQGHWKMTSSFGSTAGLPRLPAGTPLDKVGATFSIEGNELRIDGKLIATLANEFSAFGMVPEPPTRRLLMLTLPNGTAVLCAYRFASDYLQIVYPHTVINLGGYQTTFERAPKPKKEQ